MESVTGARQLERERALFVGTLRRPEPVRGAFLAAWGEQHRNEVGALLGAHARPGPLDDPPWAALLAAAPPDAAPAAATPELAPGTRLGDFVVERLLARGGSGVVYVARQAALHRDVALKVVAAEPMTAAARRRARREVEIAASVHHRHLVPVHAGGEDEERGLLYYAMRLVAGPDLACVLAALRRRERAPAPVERRALVARCLEASRGVAALHARGLVHRDVKPANIVIEGGDVARPEKGEAVVVDLGLVRDTVEPTAPPTLAGTLLYMSPEALRGERSGPEADVFALGLVLFDALTATATRARSPGPPPLLRQVLGRTDADLEAIVARATAVRARARYRDAAALADDLERWLRGVPVSARRPGPLERVWREVQLHPGRALRAAALGGVAVVASLLAAAGAIWAVGTWQQVREVRSAWREARLERAVERAAALPSWVAPWLPPALVAGEEPRSAEADVADAIRARGSVPALRIAAAWLERDGLAAHPRLASFLCRALGAPGDVGAAARRLTGRLFFERPDTSAARRAASTPFRAALGAWLACAPTPDGYALAGLAGCGDLETVVQLLGWLAQRQGADPPLENETVRLVFVALSAILTRAESCGLLAEVLELDPDALLAEAAAALPPALGWQPQTYMHASEALVGVARTLAVVHRRAGRPPPHADALRARGPLPLSLLLVLRAPAAAAALDTFSDGRDPPGAHLWMAEMFGEDVGYFDDAGATGRARAAVQRGTQPVAARGLCLALFERGFARAQAYLHGEVPWRESEATDVATHLRRLLDGPGDQVALASACAGDAAPPVRGSWDLERAPAALRGHARGVALRDASLERDEYDATCRFVALHPSGWSQLRLSFRVVGEHAGSMVCVRAQKGIRPALPSGGRATVDISCDGSSVARNMSLVEPIVYRLELPVPALASGEEHELVLELGADSDTTVRVYSVEIH